MDEIHQEIEQDIETMRNRLYTSDVIFSTPGSRYGAIVLEHIEKEKAMIAREKILEAAKMIKIKEPENIDWFYPQWSAEKKTERKRL